METNLWGLDLLVNNKKVLKKNNDTIICKTNVDNNENEKEIDKYIKDELSSIFKLKLDEDSNSDNKDIEIDEMIDDVINTLIKLMKYKYYKNNDNK